MPARTESAAARPGKAAKRSRASTWKKDPDGRRERVLAEATRLFSQRGYASVSAGDIARAAAVAEGSVFHYFGTKQDLLRAVGERYGRNFAAAMFDDLEVVARTATVEKLVRSAFDFVEGSWPGFGLFLLSDDPSAAPLAQKANRVVVTRAVENALDAWQQRGELARMDSDVVAELLFGLVEAALRACYAGETGLERTRCEAATVAAISRILGIPG